MGLNRLKVTKMKNRNQIGSAWKGVVPPEIGLKYKEKPSDEMMYPVLQTRDLPIRINRTLLRAANRAPGIGKKIVHKRAQPGLSTTSWESTLANMAYTMVPTSPGRAIAYPTLDNWTAPL
jgi:hypothetical protein